MAYQLQERIVDSRGIIEWHPCAVPPTMDSPTFTDINEAYWALFVWLGRLSYIFKDWNIYGLKDIQQLSAHILPDVPYEYKPGKFIVVKTV